MGLKDIGEHISRVESRVRKGGHDIPTETIKRRFDASYGNIEKLFKIANKLTVFDNTKAFSKQIEFTKGVLKKEDNLQKWVIEKVVKPYEKNKQTKTTRPIPRPRSKTTGKDRDF